ncbi:MAG: CPBP family glutamic-type intramembrane protease [Candidatus Hydrogenedentota bacterium]
MKASIPILLAAFVPLLLAAAGTMIEHGWLGHGLYKLGLLFVPLLFGMRFAFPQRMKKESATVALSTGLLLGLAAWLLIELILPRVADPRTIRAAFDARYHYTPSSAIAAACLIATANAVLEEWFYRGFLDDAGGKILSLFCFSLQHFIVFRGLAGTGPAFIAALAVVPAGWIWSRIRTRHGLAAASLSHIVTDAVLLVGGLRLLGYVS